MEVLEKKQAELNLPQHTLIHDVVTRWGSTYDMISKFVEQHAAVTATLMADRNTRHLVLRGTYISTLEDKCKVLKPLRTFTDSLAAETCITISSLRPVLQHLTESILAEKDDDSSLVRSMNHAICKNLQERYEDSNMANVMNMACVLDPRFKLNFMEEADSNKRQLEQHLTQESSDNVGNTSTLSQESSARGECEDEGTSISIPEAPKGLAGILKMITMKKHENRQSADMVKSTPAFQEVSAYTALPTISVDKDPLQWWKDNEEEFPRLAKLVVPTTSVASERLFSSSGNIQTVFRSSLKPEKLNMLVFLHKNLPY
ncbi:E3 SUMO-protein ligase ZBED1-like [Onychostoma macrolepis]|uniref:E3 SUMO-protein ligase ZBED1-like n=1 Tax=Onychostoma macrolepis TaxID=369639 RepID=UPI0027298007|nr:E3 SUMO-protein ligase ZBED1-like [Onychostoma macrolepis]